MRNNPKSLPLVWEFDGDGKWEAPSQVMDTEMTDEPQDAWCKELCLKWRIRVTEEGRFTAEDSDEFLTFDMGRSNTFRWDTLSVLQAHIDLIEDQLREGKTFNDKNWTPITLLPADKYAK